MEAPCLWRPPAVYLSLRKYHWRTWSYPFKCGSMFPSAVELGDPVRHHYLPNASDEHLSTVVARGETSYFGLEVIRQAHWAAFEQLALFALPSIEDEGLEDDVESDEQNDEASELGAISTDDNS
ncbi:hypothetical protein IWW34DRAFT_782640 [Fusarium oxysporum f. sp. albedinis]|nr:hypothetical protein IWW34DRAFT_782640 [Fusarium oxysporum f. sp. albedinis]